MITQVKNAQTQDTQRLLSFQYGIEQMLTVGARIQQERERLGLNFSSFGALAGVSGTAQKNYETDARSPNAEYLHALSKSGVDVLYVITGRREVGGLSPQEEELIRAYREATPERQAALVDMAKALAVVSRE